MDKSEFAKMIGPLPKDYNLATIAENEQCVMGVDSFKRILGRSDGKGVFWSDDVNAELPIKMNPGERNDLPAYCIHDFLQEKINLKGDFSVFYCKRQEVEMTWRDVGDKVDAFGRACIAVGASPRKSVNILGFNSPQWAIAFYGALCANYVTAGVYTTNAPDACQYVAEHSEGEIICVENLAQLKKYETVKSSLGFVKAFVVMEETPPTGVDDRYYSWEAFLKKGESVNQEHLNEQRSHCRPNQVCNLVYTSGTTGMPKGVMLTHDNLAYFMQTAIRDAILEYMDSPEQIHSEQQRIVSYLPLSHIAAQFFDLMTPLFQNMSVYFADPDALSGSLVETLTEVRPTFFLAVPRIYEKIEEKMKGLRAEMGWLTLKVGDWAKDKGFRHSQALERGGKAPWGYTLAHALILKQIKKRLGLDECKFFAFGAAPMKQSTLEYFMSLDMQLLNFYGMSETTGAETISWRNRLRYGKAGQACPGTHIKIFNPDEKGEGEICFKGRNMFVGYLKNEKATRETIDPEGYVHSGDLGKLDEDGYVQITGRIKELIVTAGGENVAPIPIEHKFLELCQPASQIMIVGDDKKYLSALITLKTNMTDPQAPVTNELTPENKEFVKSQFGKNYTTTDELIADPQFVTFVQKCIDETNTFSISRAAQV